MNIGFGNGDFYRLDASDEERFEEKALNRLAFQEVNSLELNCRLESSIDYILQNDLVISPQIKFISIHTPDLNYRKDTETERVLQKLEKACKKYNIFNVVFHTDKVSSWELISKYKNIPVSIENMDDRKNFGRTLGDVSSVLDKYDFGFTLDLQHCFVNDSTMQLAKDFHKTFGDRIVEYHLSGYDKELLHYPLFKTKQNIIIENLENINTPVIIESTFDKLGQQQIELEYIQKLLN